MERLLAPNYCCFFANGGAFGDLTVIRASGFLFTGSCRKTVNPVSGESDNGACRDERGEANCCHSACDRQVSGADNCERTAAGLYCLVSLVGGVQWGADQQDYQSESVKDCSHGSLGSSILGKNSALLN
jgi:hypothetical protein